MLYFYCCEIEPPEGGKRKLDGWFEVNRKIKDVKELVGTQEEIRKSVRFKLKQVEPDLNLRAANIVFLAFNPL